MSLPRPSGPVSSRQRLALVALVALGPLVNLVPLEIPLVFLYIFGSIPAFLALRLFGPLWGVVTAGAAAGMLPQFVGHPYVLVWFGGELLFVAWLEQTGRTRNLILADALYWMLLGSPLVLLSFVLLGTPSEVGLLISAKNCVNGITNATIASLLLNLLPLRRWLLGQKEADRVSLSQLLYSLMLGFLLVPSVAMVAAHLKTSLLMTEQRIGETLGEKNQTLLGELTLMMHEHPARDAAEHKLLALDVLRRHWRDEDSRNSWQITLLDGDRILLSTQADRPAGAIFDPAADSELVELSETVTHRIPRLGQTFIPIAERWRRSSYLLTNPVVAIPGWNLVVERPVGPFLPELRWSVIRVFGLLTILTYFSLALAWLLGRRIAAPIGALSRATHGLPKRLRQGGADPHWPASPVREIDELASNCREMTGSLREMFSRIRQNQQTLEQRVIQRTSELAATNAALLESEQRYQVLAEASPVGIFHADNQGRCLYVNQRWCELVGMSAGAACGDGWLAHLHPEDRERVISCWHDAVENRSSLQMEYRYLRPDQSIVWVFAQASPQHDSHGGSESFIGTITDISDRVASEKRLRENESRLNQLAYHDVLTDLPNRLLFQDRLEHALAVARRAGYRVALLFLDLDRFKKINDTLGHDWGDNLLREVAQRLTGCVRASDTVARLGGDEFMVILDRVDDLPQVAAVAQKILTRLAHPIEMRGYSLFTTASIGISLFPNDGDKVETLMKCADSAMYRAKEMGRNNYQLYTADMNARAHELLLLESSLRQALERDQLVLHYQPQYDLAGGRLIGLEALVRWHHPEHGMISPADFIPLAEETGLIVPIGEWVLRTACAQNRAWQQAGWPPVRMAVNISARQFRQTTLVERTGEILAETGLEARWLELELTESMIMGNTESAIHTMHAFNAIGVEMAIDDFGSGYSSLAYLKRFPINKLKIDQEFVRDVLVDGNDAAIATSVIALAKSMHLEVIAEGVETAEQLAFLRDRGCHQGQGYFFSRPLPAEQVPELFGERPAAREVR